MSKGPYACIMGKVLFLASKEAARRTPFGMLAGSVRVQIASVVLTISTAKTSSSILNI